MSAYSRANDAVAKFSRAATRGGNRKVLVAEMAATAIIVAVSHIAEQKEAPPPRIFIASFIVFLVLAFIAEFGDEWARFAVAFGGLVLLAIAIVHAAGIARAIMVGANPPAGTRAPVGPPASAPSPNAPAGPPAGKRSRSVTSMRGQRLA